MSEIAELVQALERRIIAAGPVIVAVSGGVDSTVVADLAARGLGDRALSVTAASPALPRADLARVQELAALRGWKHRVVTTRELERPGYQRNGSDRCYHCKAELFSVIKALPEAAGASILTGTNLDDLGDHRPGLEAAAESSVLAPLAESGVRKAGVREIARHLGLPTAEQPASPCLASRIAYGVEVDTETLNRIERSEAVLHRLGLPVVRVRVHGEMARIEVPSKDLETLFVHREDVDRQLRSLGFTYVAIDLKGFRSGSLNESLPILSG